MRSSYYRERAQIRTRRNSPGPTSTPVIGQAPLRPFSSSPSSSSPSTASHPHLQQTTHPEGNTAGFCHFLPHNGHFPYSVRSILYCVGCRSSADGAPGGVVGGVKGSKSDEGNMGSGRGGSISACIAAVGLVSLVRVEMARGEEGEYHHHCESFNNSSSGGRSGGNLDHIDESSV